MCDFNKLLLVFTLPHRHCTIVCTSSKTCPTYVPFNSQNHLRQLYSVKLFYLWFFEDFARSVENVADQQLPNNYLVISSSRYQQME